MGSPGQWMDMDREENWYRPEPWSLAVLKGREMKKKEQGRLRRRSQ